MARLLNESFEAGHLLRFSATGGATNTTAPTGSLTVADGTRCCQLSAGNLNYTVATPVSELYAGFFWDSNNMPAENAILVWYDATITEMGRFRMESGTGKMLIVVGGVTVATGTSANNSFTQYHFQVRIKIANAGGVIEIKRDDGTEVLTFNGDTQPGANSTIGLVQWNAPNSATVDCCVINNTSGVADNSYPGILRFQRMLPSGPGFYVNNWSRNTGSTNWEAVDEVPPDGDTTYLFTSSPNIYESFSMSDQTLVSVNYKALLTAVIAKKDSGTVQLAVGIRDNDNSTNYYVANSPLATSYGVLEGRQTTDPSTGTTWNAAGINATEALIVSTTG